MIWEGNEENLNKICDFPWMDEWINEKVDGWVARWTDGWTDRQIFSAINARH